MKEVEELMIPPDGVKGKLNGMLGCVPPDKRCELLDGELTHELWDEKDSEILLLLMTPTCC